MTTSAARGMLEVGSIIADTYLLESLLGKGGMGSVYLASHVRLPGKKLAIKLLHAELHDEEVLARFRREAEIASRLGHPNIVSVNDYNVTADGTPYLVLEYLHGETLAQRLTQGPLPLEQALSIVRQVGSALAAAHREGIVHRDLKPQNVFLVPTEVDGRTIEVAKVLDFGISKIRGSDTVKTLESSLLGTPQYMAPEQATGQHSAVDERTDVFAFGAMVYEMLCGHPAFSGASIPEVVFKVVYEQPAPLATEAPGLPTNIVDAITHAMQKKSADRCPTVSAFVETMTGVPLATVRPPTQPPPMNWPASSKAGRESVEAFAQTVGSGDHGPAVAAGANTVQSMSSPGVTAQRKKDDPMASASTAFPSAAERGVGGDSLVDTGASTVAKRSSAALVIVGLAVIAAAAATIVFVTRGHGDEPKRDEPIAHTAYADAASAMVASGTAPAQPPAPPLAPIDAANVAMAAPADAHMATPLDAGVAHIIKPPVPLDAASVAVAVAATPDAGSAKGSAATTAHPVTNPDEVDEPGGSAAAGATQEDRDHVRAAEKALEDGNTAGAMLQANAALNSSAPFVVRHAQQIRGVIYCRQQDQENASAAFRAAAVPRWRHKIVQECKKTGTPLPGS